MLPRTIQPVSLGRAADLYTRPDPGQSAARRRSSRSQALRVVQRADRDLVAAAVETAYRPPTADRHVEPPVQDLGRDAPSAAGRTPAECPGRPASQTGCVEQTRCGCASSDQTTDAERALMIDISRQAARVRAVSFWVFVLVALGATVALLLA